MLLKFIGVELRSYVMKYFFKRKSVIKKSAIKKSILFKKINDACKIKLIKTFNKQTLSSKLDQNNYHYDDRLDLRNSRQDNRLDLKSSR